jgi:SAM-dependent methyltransferase
MHCRYCGVLLERVFIDLGTAPPSNAYLSVSDLQKPEKYFPLRVFACHACGLVQTEDFTDARELFDDSYAYFSGFSTSWLEHCRTFVDTATRRFGLNQQSLVVEIAANDGYLLQFVRDRRIPCLGIEPTRSTANAARGKGIEIIEEFFGKELGESLSAAGRSADLVIGNNVLAHVPDINGFMAGVHSLLKPNGVAVFEFPHLLRLVAEVQFDTIYHEHFSYLSLTVVEKIFANQALTIFDVEELPTHGGSLRVFAQRQSTGSHHRSNSVTFLKERERGLTESDSFRNFQLAVERIKAEFIDFLLRAKRNGKKVAGYGAAAKGSTLLNFAGVRGDLICWVADANPAKQGKFLPGSRIPIVSPEKIAADRPDYLVVFPWNLIEEVRSQQSELIGLGMQLVTAIPRLRIVSPRDPVVTPPAELGRSGIRQNSPSGGNSGESHY